MALGLAKGVGVYSSSCTQLPMLVSPSLHSGKLTAAGCQPAKLASNVFEQVENN